MFFTEIMRYVQIVVLKQDFEKAVDIIGENALIEINTTKGGSSKEKNTMADTYSSVENIDDLDSKIYDIVEFFELPKISENGSLRNIYDIKKYIDFLYEEWESYIKKYKELNVTKSDYENQLIEIERFKNLDMSKEELENLTYIHYVLGSMGSEDIKSLKEELKDRVAIKLISDNLYVIFTSKKGRWTLESSLKKRSFKEVKITGDGNKLPLELYNNLKESISSIKKRLKEIADFRDDFLEKERGKIVEYIKSLNLQKVYQDIHQSVLHSDSLTVIEGWITKRKLPKLKTIFEKNLGDKFSMISFLPEDLEEVKTGKMKIPVVMSNPKLLKPFEMLLFNYGTPTYKSVDPTFFLAITFILFFGMMYGDMGQGLVIFIIGLIIQRIKGFKDLGFIVSTVGIAAIFFGFIYGSFFCFEYEKLEPVLSPLYRTIFNNDGTPPIKLDPNNSNVIFGVTIFMGVIINLLGMMINIINNLLKKRIVNVLFTSNGISGFIFLLTTLIVLVNLAVYGTDPNKVMIGIMIATISLIAIHEPLEHIIKRKPVFPNGFVGWFFFNLIEMFEVLLNYINANISFIRIGAFAFAHIVLSTTTTMLMKSANGGEHAAMTIGGIIILIVGNIVVIGLEGLIVGIQAVRLEYYEFFSKFFNEQGTKFNPFKIERK